MGTTSDAPLTITTMRKNTRRHDVGRAGDAPLGVTTMYDATIMRTNTNHNRRPEYNTYHHNDNIDYTTTTI